MHGAWRINYGFSNVLAYYIKKGLICTCNYRHLVYEILYLKNTQNCLYVCISPDIQDCLVHGLSNG